jgi:hypothetical protein
MPLLRASVCEAVAPGWMRIFLRRAGDRAPAASTRRAEGGANGCGPDFEWLDALYALGAAQLCLVSPGLEE